MSDTTPTSPIQSILIRLDESSRLVGHGTLHDPDKLRLKEAEKALLEYFESLIDGCYEYSKTDLELWEYQNKTEKPVISKTELRERIRSQHADI